MTDSQLGEIVVGDPGQLSDPRPPAESNLPPEATFFVLLPQLSASEKEKYIPVRESSLRSEIQLQIDEVIGEYRDGPILFYFARHDKGIAHKFPSVPFKKAYGVLVDEYERKKKEGQLEPFDPSAHYVHPNSRLRTIVRIRRNEASVDISSVRSRQVRKDILSDTTIGEDDESEGDDDSYDNVIYPRRKHPSRRKKRGFNSRRTRSAEVIDSDDSSSNERGHIPSRQSTRLRRGVRVAYGSAPSSAVDSDSDMYTPHTMPTKVKRIVRGKASRPAYGYLRTVADLDYDSHSDDESAPLREHRQICERCHRGPAHELIEAFMNKPKSARTRRKKTPGEFEISEDEEEKLNNLGGWVRCLKCPVAAHWRCLASAQRDEISKAVRHRERVGSLGSQSVVGNEPPKDPIPEPVKRVDLGVYQTTEFICGPCTRGGICMGCMETALEADNYMDPKLPEPPATPDSDHPMKDATMNEHTTSSGANKHHSATELLFRCLTCKRLAHYRHLPIPKSLSADVDPIGLAVYYQDNNWLCGDCLSFTNSVDKIIAWRSYPANASQPIDPPNEPPHYKNALPREYLVKWMDRSYQRAQWVPHMWLLATHPAKLKNFLFGGTRVALLSGTLEESVPSTDGPAQLFHEAGESRASSTKPGTSTPGLPQDPIPDAERRIPIAWKTIDRLLDVLLWSPKRRKVKKRGKRGNIEIQLVDSDEDEDGTSEGFQLALDQGIQPDPSFTESIIDWETRTGEEFTTDNIGQVVWAFIKWDDLGYEEATWDSPPQKGDSRYDAFQMALTRFLRARSVSVPRLSKTHAEKFDARAKDEYRSRHLLKDASQLQLGQNPKLKLMPFQVDGFNWLCDNWWRHQHCILADEMGLGKTVQIATFIGNISQNFQAFPALVVVPNSTITNWIREFERWAPNLRVVPFYGEAKAREIIKKYELRHDAPRQGDTAAKYHVLVTTYETLLNPKDFGPVFKAQPRWEVLVIDEGQRLKSDTSLLFRKLNELNSVHRIIMTGTPLNNNIRELFNLMNFLDPNEWKDLEGLEKEHEELTEALVKQLHNRLRPYFLRRIKSEVLDLPPKNEVIVPLSMAPLQKEVYRSILTHNLDLLKGLTQLSLHSKAKSGTSKSSINNILMQLRKCLQHPYLYDEGIEPRGLSPQEVHEKLIDGSAKLRFLRALLPKLKERGHRILLFSQFVIALNIIEDFLVGEGHKFLRLDGNTSGRDRQKGMDEFNQEGSDIFIYLLTTRAGGVGINLFSADTVIIFDPDFNPHQAIARAHRFGQKKTCLVFKLMVKESAEERIIQVGKKKLVLDHLIVQKMDDDESAGENVQSILTYGAQALFASEDNSRDIIYTDNDIEKLIDKTEKEGDQEEEVAKEGAMSFSFAKIWAADKDTLEEVEEVDQGDAWAQTLQTITTERAKIQQEVAKSGRGVRRRAAAAAKYTEESPSRIDVKKRQGSKHTSDGSAYAGSDIEHSSDESDEAIADPISESELTAPRNRDLAPTGLAGPVGKPGPFLCGLCGTWHDAGGNKCAMTEHSGNLAEYREMLLLHAEDEPWEQRAAAIRAIDETLYLRGQLSLIVGQPLYLVPPPPKAPSRPKKKPQATGQPPAPKSNMTAASHQSMKQGRPFDSSATQLGYQPPMAGPSKRASSPGLDNSRKNKQSRSTNLSSPCIVCGQTPHHLIKNCPLVSQGPTSISQQIKRLDQDPHPQAADTVKILRRILIKQKKRESGTHNSDSMVVDT
ncbi:SNF2 family N-terminal domain-containing protein [Infundibulicybe gibba]|nr:SNF2 family N-terminal domain-containing protein [Infundibulicybe gibba]